VGGGKYEVQLEGNFWPSIGPHGNWYDTPFAIMVPKRGTGANLLVPVAVSASAVAFSSTRIENWYMSVGAAAGAASKQLVDGDVSTVQDIDVSKIQSILTGLGQRIHGPPGHPSPPPTPHVARPAYYNVTGAGSAAWNGQYKLSSSSYEGSVLYQSTSSSCPNSMKCSLYALGGVWRLASLGRELWYVASSKTGATPPLSGWALKNGTAPAPTLVAGPNTI
jgi:hypothetical protein